jgi:sugar phosphate isomerase/epimerase
MRKIGLKLFSVNENYISEAVRLWENGLYQFVELYAVPDSYDRCIGIWIALRKQYGIPFVVHAPHFMHGMNPGLKEKAETNKVLFSEAARYADALLAAYIIMHPGIGGEIEETARQLKAFDDSRIIVENKPYHTVYTKDQLCNGSTPEEIALVLQKAGVGFCLDVGHCFCAAYAQGLDPFSYLNRFLAFAPKIVHLADNTEGNPFDMHLHLGKGAHDLKQVLAVLPADCLLTIETDKDSQVSLGDFEEDVRYIKQISFESGG